LPAYAGVEPQKIHFKGEGACEGEGEWHFVITQIRDEASAPAKIWVEWNDGATEEVLFDKYTGKTAHYQTTSHGADADVDDAWTFIYAEWDGEFNLSHRPCSSPPPLGTISGCKFNDLDGNGEWDDGEPGLPQWGIIINGETLNSSTYTDGEGCYEFADLEDDTYTVSEVLQEGWQQTYPEEGSYEVEISGGTEFTAADFGNYLPPPPPSGAIYGCKFEDLDGNGKWDRETEPTISEWTINLSGGDLETVPAITDETGCYEFAGLPDGEYIVSEVLQTGWEQTYPTEDGSYTITITEGGSYEAADFGNYLPPPPPPKPEPEPDLEVEKEVSTESTEVNTVVTYTIIVSNTGETVLDITVTDVPPAGFTYITGSALADGVPNEPTLSGGSLIWELKAVDPKTDVIITYQMDVGSTADQDPLANTVFAASGGIKDWDPAEVLVTEEEEETPEGEVLGVRNQPEVLAETGATPARLLIIWAMASIMLGLGLILRIYAQTLAKKSAS